MYEAFLKASSKAKNCFWIESRTGEDMEQFSAGPGPTNKAVPSFRTRLMESRRRLVKNFVFALSGMQLTATTFNNETETETARLGCHD